MTYHFYMRRMLGQPGHEIMKVDPSELGIHMSERALDKQEGTKFRASDYGDQALRAEAAARQWVRQNNTRARES